MSCHPHSVHFCWVCKKWSSIYFAASSEWENLDSANPHVIVSAIFPSPLATPIPVSSEMEASTCFGFQVGFCCQRRVFFSLGIFLQLDAYVEMSLAVMWNLTSKRSLSLQLASSVEKNSLFFCGMQTDHSVTCVNLALLKIIYMPLRKISQETSYFL